MYAVIKTGGKQFKVAAGSLIAVDTLAGEPGDTVAFEEVLIVGNDAGTTVGNPLVGDATVAAEIVRHGRTAKILVFKKRRRQNSKRSHGHRQNQTFVRITEILTDGRKPELKAAETATETADAPAKPARKPRAKAAAKAENE